MSSVVIVALIISYFLCGMISAYFDLKIVLEKEKRIEAGDIFLAFVIIFFGWVGFLFPLLEKIDFTGNGFNFLKKNGDKNEEDKWKH